MPTCETCLHWQRYSTKDGVDRGDCNSTDPRLPCVALDPSTYRPVLVTRADFGCVVHAAFDEDVTRPQAPEASQTR